MLQASSSCAWCLPVLQSQAFCSPLKIVAKKSPCYPNLHAYACLDVLLVVIIEWYFRQYGLYCILQCASTFFGKTLGRAFHVNTTVNLCRKPGIAQFDTEEQQLVPAPWGRAGKTECEPGLFTKHAPDSCGRTGDNSRIPGWKSFQERLLEAEFMKRSTDGRCAYL